MPVLLYSEVELFGRKEGGVQLGQGRVSKLTQNIRTLGNYVLKHG